jgi:hypothetical protein
MVMKTLAKLEISPPIGALNRLLDFGLPLGIIGGKNLKYILSDLPVCAMEMEEQEIEALARRVQTSPCIKMIESEGGLKLVASDDDGEWHFIYRTPGSTVSLLTIDDLTYDPASGEWTGDGRSIDDLNNATARIRDGMEIDSGTAFEFAALISMLDFKPHADSIERLTSVFSEVEARKLSRRFLGKILRKIVCGAKPSRGFLLLDAIGALDSFLPELATGKGLSQNRYHLHDIFYHSIFTCDAVPQPDLVIRLAGIFHDLGKVDTRRVRENGEATFHNHEIISSKISDRVLHRLGFDPLIIKRVRFLVRNHMFHYTDEWTDRAVRRFISKVGPDDLDDLITLRLADRKGSGKRSALPKAIRTMMRHIDDVRAREAELKITDLAIDGHTLMDMGMEPGPQMGAILKEMLHAVKTGAIANEESILREEAKRMILAGEHQ